ncbi:tRNA wybutosine-synthesizing protein 3 homolog [Mixophyes fleayi]|uniref:tRNA wybutosine-synthesizing protein 3 homolog n=1 Tax=Mixophyes fleayi TaxID=3061075 RepID=UPI003F4E13C3
METSPCNLQESQNQSGPCSLETPKNNIPPCSPLKPQTISSTSEPSGLFSHWKLQSSRRTDLSKKGSVDKDIEDTVRDINLQDCYFTTSSCSGRIILIDENLDLSIVQKQNCLWLFVTHEFCGSDDVFAALQKASGDAVMKFEPFVLHVQCRTLEDAQLLHNVAINSGFRNSGITVGKKGKIIMAVRSTHCLEVPLSHKGQCMVSNQYMDFLVQIANQKMEENKKRIARFYCCLQTALQKRNGVSGAEREAEAPSAVYTRRRRRHDVDKSSDCGPSEGEDDPETSILFHHDDILL